MEAGVERNNSLAYPATLRFALHNKKYLMRKTIAVQLLLRGCEEAVRSAHCDPVIFVGRPAGEADLVMTAVVIDARPGETVGATLPEKQLQEVHGFT